MRFVGIDHGSRAFRMASIEGSDLPRQWRSWLGDIGADTFALAERREWPRQAGIAEAIAMEIGPDDAVVMSYSMGDSLTSFTPYDMATDHGVTTMAGAGRVVGEGSRLVDMVADRARSCHIAPGLHRDLPTLDPRFRTLYSHHGSGDNVLAAFRALMATGDEDLVLSDVSTNTVTLAIKRGRIVAGFDAAVGALGVLQGPLDLDGIRLAEQSGATEAFDRGGIARKPSFGPDGRPEGDGNVQFMRGAPLSPGRLDALSLAIAMEVRALGVLGKFDAVVLTGWAIEENPLITDAVAAHLGRPVRALGRFAAAEGGAMAAIAVDGGAEELLGIPILR